MYIHIYIYIYIYFSLNSTQYMLIERLYSGINETEQR